ncbi:MAG: hypothetical protein MPW16_00760 [Candidatus Manganitrophus sp.]|nr:MAG: hypothetical protein MPW16_00760 [Candidatus Manganitrophus sp.]
MNIDRFAPLRFDLFYRLFSGGVVDIDRHDPGPFARKKEGRLHPDSTSCPRDQGDLVS